jgi:hypothetical protein
MALQDFKCHPEEMSLFHSIRIGHIIRIYLVFGQKLRDDYAPGWERSAFVSREACGGAFLASAAAM